MQREEISEAENETKGSGFNKMGEMGQQSSFVNVWIYLQALQPCQSEKYSC